MQNSLLVLSLLALFFEATNGHLVRGLASRDDAAAGTGTGSSSSSSSSASGMKSMMKSGSGSTGGTMSSSGGKMSISGTKSKSGTKSSSAKESECECNGATEYKYLEKEVLYHLALARLGADTDADTSAIDFTFHLAVNLAPPRCYLASVESNFEERQLESACTTESCLGFVGAFKDLEDAYEDRNDEDVHVRRDGWHFLDGAAVDDQLWASDSQPPQTSSTKLVDTPSVALFNQDGLLGVSLDETAPGAYYKCCFEVIPACFDKHPTDLDNFLLGGILAAKAR